jgi:hypothetical protein
MRLVGLEGSFHDQRLVTKGERYIRGSGRPRRSKQLKPTSMSRRCHNSVRHTGTAADLHGQYYAGQRLMRMAAGSPERLKSAWEADVLPLNYIGAVDSEG